MARRLWRQTPIRLLFICISCIILFYIYLALSPISEPCKCIKDKEGSSGKNSHGAGMPFEEEGSNKKKLLQQEAEINREYLALGDDPRWGPHKLCVLVPFRDRFEELMEFAPHMHKFLNAQQVRHKLVIVNQGDKYRFNRAMLINIGFQQTEEDCDYMAMHDVDLLPLNPLLKYIYPAEGPYHVAAPSLHPKYHYKTFVGGILLLSREQFKKCNGLSNRYWGWGREDDEFYVRMIEAKFKIQRPKNITTGYDTFKHAHDRDKRPRDYSRYGDQKRASRYRDYRTGLNTATYNSLERHDLRIDGAPVTILNVELSCDLEDTSWCVHPDQLKNIKKRQNDARVAADADIAAARMQIEQAKRQTKLAQEAEGVQ